MKYNVRTLSSSEYLDLVNGEENPDNAALNITYARLGDGYFAFARTAYGKFISTTFNKGRALEDSEIEPFFDKMTEEITAMYNTKKDSMITPGSFVLDPRRPL